MLTFTYGYIVYISILQFLLPITISFIVTILSFIFVKNKWEDKITFVIKPFWFGFIFWFLILIVVLISGFQIEETSLFFKEQGILLENNQLNYFNVILMPKPIFWLLGSLVAPSLSLLIDIRRPNHAEEIIKAKERKKKIEDQSNVPLDYDKNIFVIGKSGAGKTVALLNFIKTHIEKNHFSVIIDGKGDIGKYGLYDVVTKLAKKHNRKIYIINQSIPNETHGYNPFKDCNETEIKDMLINMSNWSEEHYKSLASEYWQALAQFLIKTKQPINFQSLTKYSNFPYFLNVLNEYDDVLNKEDYNYYKNAILSCGETVVSAKSRFSVVANGVGKSLFPSDDSNTFNLKQAYEENAIVLVLLNNLQYTDFARSVGQLVLDDIKNLCGYIASNTTRKEEPFLVVYDEMSTYFAPRMVDIINKSRSLGATNIYATQTIADMDIIDENARRQILGNTHGFYVLKLSDDKSAETIANTIGTNKTSEITSKVDMFGKTGDGTSKIVDEYKIHPNDLKEMPLEVGYWFDSMQKKAKPIKTKLDYVDVSDITSYKFKPINKEIKKEVITEEVEEE